MQFSTRKSEIHSVPASVLICQRVNLPTERQDCSVKLSGLSNQEFGKTSVDVITKPAILDAHTAHINQI